MLVECYCLTASWRLAKTVLILKFIASSKGSKICEKLCNRMKLFLRNNNFNVDILQMIK